MTTEEKAKAYDEVREIIALKFGSNVAEEIFSKFEETENEKIRKALINVFDTHKDYEMFFGVSVKDILSWLEKQGEQKTVEWGKEDENYIYNIAYFLEHPTMLGECNKHIAIEMINWIKSIKNRMQPQEWSKEDEDMIQALNACIDATIKSGMNYISFDSKSILIGKVKNWVKSIKNRVIPQPKQEWDGTEIAPPIDSDVCG